MIVFVEREGKKEKVDFSGKAGALLEKLAVNPEEVLIVVDGEVVTVDFVLKGDEKVELLSVVSGG